MNNKWNKLKNSPVAFLRDSKVAPLRVIGNIASKALALPVIHLSTQKQLKLYSNTTLNIKLRANQTSRLRTFKKARYPKVSIIIPAFNAQDTIGASIESLLKQTYKNIEIIIINDASTDNTLRGLKEFEHHSQIRIVNNTRNHGAAYSKNLGLRESSGEYITFQDSDDISLKHRIEIQLYSLLNAPKKLVSISQYQRMTEDRTPIRLNDRIKSKALVTLFFKKSEVFEKLGYFCDTRIGEDSEYYQRIIAFYGYESIRFLSDVLYLALLRQDSLTFNDGTLKKVNKYAYEHNVSDKTRKQLLEQFKAHPLIKEGKVSPYQEFTPR